MVREKIIFKPRKEQESVCPFCRDDIDLTEASHSCVGCLTKFHDDCFKDELKSKCTTLGCDQRQKITVITTVDTDDRRNIVRRTADDWYREREERLARIQAKRKWLNGIYYQIKVILLLIIMAVGVLGAGWLFQTLLSAAK